MTQEKQRAFDERYLRMAHIWAENSYALRLKVGSLMVKDGMIISDGYNGMPSGFPNCCEGVSDLEGKKIMTFNDPAEVNRYYTLHPQSKLVTYNEVLHAEANAITKVAKSNNSSVGATLYVTDAPCLNCAKLIIQAGIVRVVYDRNYRDTAGIQLLRQAGIEVTRISLEEAGNAI